MIAPDITAEPDATRDATREGVEAVRHLRSDHTARALMTVPEIRTITDMHRVSVLNGIVTAQDVYNAVRGETRDVIHFASHSDEHGVLLSNGEWLQADDIVQVARLGRVRLLFFNSCYASKLAAYATGHGIAFVIASTVALVDRDAWKMPLAFYEYCREQLAAMGLRADPKLVDLPAAFMASANGDGDYMLLRSGPTQGEIGEVRAQLDIITDRLRLQWLLIASGVASWLALAYLVFWHILR